MSVVTTALAGLLLLMQGSFTAAVFQDDDESVKEHWALLVAGSSGWGNYRHQADVAHAYQALKKGGFDASRIIVMMADDVAHVSWNPYPGELFNCPTCGDVYAGLRVDYRADDVTAANLLSVLRGDSMHGIGSGRTLASGPHDRVFFFYSDHGATGLVGMPSGPPLYADDLAKALKEKYHAGGFHELVAFVEACESGSMFQGLLGADLPVFATTASNASESSWATYCPSFGSTAAVDAVEVSAVSPMEIGVCLGDLYSVSWIEMAEAEDLHTWSLQKQFEAIRLRTSANHTYQYGSHAQEYGAMRISRELSSDFEGSHAALAAAAARGPDDTAVLQHDADLVHLRHRIATGDPESAAAAERELQAELRERSRIDRAVLAATGAVLKQHLPAGQITSLRSMPGDVRQEAEMVEEQAQMWLASQPARVGEQRVVDSWECLRAFVGSYERHCGPLSTYAARHSAAMAKLCNAAAPPAIWDAALAAVCK